MGMGPARAILFGTLVVGALDLIDAVVFFGLRGVRPIRIFQSIAAGLNGILIHALGVGVPSAWFARSVSEKCEHAPSTRSP